MTTTYGFKAMNADMTCRDYQFEIGKTYQIDNNKPLELCSDAGFHFCLNFETVFDYYNWNSSRVFKIKTEAEVVTEKDKSITKEITILEEIALEKMDLKQFKNREAKLFVINNLSDRNLIFNTFKDDKFWKVRLEVIKKLSDENLIYSFKDDKDWYVRRAVIEKLSDEKLIFDTFKDDERRLVRRAVVNKLSDEKLIYDTFKDDEDSDVREAVVEKLEELKKLY